MEKRLFFLLLFFISPLLAKGSGADNLSATGRALANYKSCALVALDIDDQVMYHYYNDMFSDSAFEIRGYPLSQSEIVFKAFDESLDRLVKIDREALTKLCLSRLDLLSRQMQEKKLREDQE